MAKDIQRSIRFSKHIFDYVDGYRGSGFSEKFENMVIDAMEGEQSRERRLGELDRLIAGRRAELDSLRGDLELFYRVSRDASILESSMQRLVRIMEGRLEDGSTGAM